MRLGLIFLIGLTVLATTQVTGKPQSSPLAPIVSRYGGDAKLAEAELLFKEGRRCGVLGPCQDFRYYRKGASNIRLEESFQGPVWSVKIIHEGVGREFYVGPWWNRAWFWATGLKDGPLESIMATDMRLDFQQAIFNFLHVAESSGVSFEGKVFTSDGRSADSFSQPLSHNNTTVHYLFDPETHLCLQRTLTTSSGPQPFSIVIYSDYRDVNGLPYPFRTQLLAGKAHIRDEILQSVQIGVSLDDRLFTERPNEPLWVFPLVALGAAIIISPVVIWGWSRRRQT